ncbi:hypothetical protein MKX03_002386 [Papaver bracteatum]|nr:hypothetical protein MKX03_002386 [Papaver bracteatum]
MCVFFFLCENLVIFLVSPSLSRFLDLHFFTCSSKNQSFYKLWVEATSPHVELLDAAYKGDLNRFKRLALNHAKGERIGVAETVEKLINEGGRGSLHVAAAGGGLEVCKYLLETLKLDVDSRDRKGRTPLHHASLKGHFDTVRYLLEKGADPDVSDDMNTTPLICAVKSGDTKILTLLFSRGAHVDAATRLGAVSYTALWYAASLGHRNAVEVLLDHGANPNGVNSVGMLTPLITAIFSKSWECLKLLLQVNFLNFLVAQFFFFFVTLD